MTNIKKLSSDVLNLLNLYEKNLFTESGERRVEISDSIPWLFGFFERSKKRFYSLDIPRISQTEIKKRKSTLYHSLLGFRDKVEASYEMSDLNYCPSFVHRRRDQAFIDFFETFFFDLKDEKNLLFFKSLASFSEKGIEFYKKEFETYKSLSSFSTLSKRGLDELCLIRRGLLVNLDLLKN